MRELREPYRYHGDREHRVAERPEVGKRLLEHIAIVHVGDNDHLRVEFDSTCSEALELLYDVGNARIVQEHLAHFPRRRVNRDIKGRQSVLEDPLEIALLQVRERGEVSVGEGKPVVVVTHIQVATQTLRKALDEAELALVGAPPHARRLELYAERFTQIALELDLQDLAIRAAGRDEQVFLRCQKLPIQEVVQLSPVDREKLGTGEDAYLLTD
jgi:hypothetical protein